MTGAQAEEAWTATLRVGANVVFDQSFESLVPRIALIELLEAHLEDERARGQANLLAGVIAPTVVRRFRQDVNPMGRWLTDEGKKALLDLVSEADLIDTQWIRTLFREPAMEVLVADTLLASLKDFSSIVPRLVQGLAASTLGRFAKLGGLGSLGGGLGGRLVEELERRLEPEIKKFVQGGTRRALEGAARFSVDHVDDPVSVESRRNLVRFVLDQPGQFHVNKVTDARLDAVRRIALEVAAAVQQSPESRQIVREVVETFYDTHGATRVRDFFAEAGISADPPFEQWGRATWPIVRGVLMHDEVRAWMDRLAADLVTEFSDGEP